MMPPNFSTLMWEHLAESRMTVSHLQEGELSLIEDINMLLLGISQMRCSLGTQILSEWIPYHEWLRPQSLLKDGIQCNLIAVSCSLQSIKVSLARQD